MEATAPLISSSLHSMPPPLQIISVGCGKHIQFPPFKFLTPVLAAVIIAAKAFWVNSVSEEAFWANSSSTKGPQITAASQLYFQSSTAEHVRVAILEAFKDACVHYDTPESVAALEQLVLKNQMSTSRPSSVV
ncbi:hypothetical protein BOTBODRAFT_280436 [Botryobasidium botryosum FD-172 SS1]|uniref:Uncharacterized protein n=1 Tax=Botryobasidium botryosum (strain FD-172 SS1) TaxID=930990 RepID=A0A067M2W1_BOTB1|nr:hypothetical protein BOTBODRAFT_280436 [Botryobasidium botryosum FD-172 SS1]